MKTKSKLFRIIMLFLIIGSIGIVAVAGINFGMLSYAKPYTYTCAEANTLDDIQCIMVLGCGVYDDRPTPLLEDRLQRGVEAYEAGLAPKILMTGDHGRDDYDEVNIMKQYALDAGIDQEHIFMDHAGFSTYESMCRAKEIFGVDKLIIVTQKYHLPRAVYLARMLGIEAYGIESDHRSFGGQFYRDCREVLARVKDLFVGIIQPPPTYLGDAIPISGSGTATNG